MSTPTTAPSALRGPDGLAIIGRTLHDLRGIRFDEGEGGNTAGTATGAVAGAGTTDATSTGAATGTASTETATATGASTATGKVEDLPEWAQKIIRDTRQEAATHRTAKTAAEQASEQKQQDLIKAFATAAGIQLPGETPDPAKLAADLTAAQTTAKQSAIQLAVYKAAATHQGNPDALLDSNTFLAKVSTLDPTAADFSDQVSEAIKAAVTANPTLKSTARAAGASTVTNAGGTGENGQITEEQLARMTPEQIQEAFDKGLLKNLLTT